MPSERDAVAVVGIGCRFPPDTRGSEQFWSFLTAGGDAVGDVPRDRWHWEAYYDDDPAKPGKMDVRRGAFLTQRVEECDAAFFSIAPREAAQLDPQQRLLLEVSWEAFEDAGLDVWSLRGSRTGVFVGAFMLDNLLQRTEPAARDEMGPQTPLTCTNTVLASRLSYFYDLRGPSMAIDTACSSSLVAIHQAVRTLLAGDCDLVVAGGVNRIFRPEASLMMAKGRLLAPDGRSKAFSARADGYGRGEGCGMVVLKRLDDARADGDRIYAVVEGTGVNQDGRTDGPALPSATAQADLVRSVLRRAVIDPATVAYVEAHGTGTAVGDPIEMAALGQVLGRHRGGAGPCVVGSVKAGIGHAEGAAGVAGFIKAALVAHRRVVPRQAWLDELNPAIDFDGLGLRVASENIDLGAVRRPLRVAVNSFGYGGTNAHVVLTAPPASRPRPTGSRRRAPSGTPFFPPVALVSGHTEAAAVALAAAYAERLRRTPEGSAPGRELLAAFASRTAHEHRHAVRGRVDGFADLLDRLGAGGSHPDILSGRAVGNRALQPAFVFSGMGPQWWGMGRELLEKHAGFRAHAERCDEVFRELAGWSVLAELLAPEDRSRVRCTEVAQPAHFVVQTGIVGVLAEHGVVPAAVVGHSVGEAAAAHTAGGLSLEDALTVVFHRSRLQATVAGAGAMLATELDEQDARALVDAYEPAVSIAAVNATTATTLAGDSTALDAIAQELAKRGVFCRLLRVEVAYHSPAMDPILPELRGALAAIRPRNGTVPTFSTVDEQFDGARWDAAYWAANARQPVLFHAAGRRLVAAGHRVLVEIGPHPVLGLYLTPVLARARGATIVPTLHRGRADAHALGDTLTHLWLHGVPVDWRPVLGDRRAHDLPPYPWQRQEYWQESATVRRTRTAEPAATDRLHGQPATGCPGQWDVELSPTTIPWCRQHRVDGAAVFPAAGFLEALVSHARRRAGGTLPVVVEDMTIERPLVLAEHEDPVLRLAEGEDGRITLLSRGRTNLEGWRKHGAARLGRGPYRAPDGVSEGRGASALPLVDLGLDADSIYRGLAERGLDYAGPFRAVRSIRVGDGSAEIDLEATEPLPGGYTAYPPLLDAGLHGALASQVLDAAGLLVPVRIGRAVIYRDLPARGTVRATVTRATDTTVEGDLTFLDPTGTSVAVLHDVELRRLARTDSEEGWLDERTYEALWNAVTPPGRPQEAMPRQWLVASPDDDLVSAVRGHLAELGLEVAAIAPDLAQVVRDLPVDVDGMILDLHPNDPDAALRDARDILDLVQRLEAAPAGGPLVELVFVTQHAHAVVPDDRVEGWRSGWTSGFRRTAANEAHRVVLRSLDHDSHDLPALVRAAVGTRAEELAVRYGRIYEPQVQRRSVTDATSTWWAVAGAKDPGAVPNHRLVSAAATLQDLVWVEQPRRSPGVGEIELRVEAVGLNYKDVVKQLGLLDENATARTFIGSGLGMEMSAVVERVGPDVRDLEVGVRLGAAVAGGGFARYVTAPIDAIRWLPSLPEWSAIDAAGVLVTFCTAHRAIAELGRLQPGETLLLHGATGGVGFAAFQVAQHLGGRVFATASTDEKRALARRLGAERTYDSRTLDFVDDVLAATDGRGVDVILNTLPGDGLRANLRVAAEGARVIDISKREILDGGVLPLRLFDKNVTFAAFDLDYLANDRDQFMALAERVHAIAERGHYRPAGLTSFPAAQVTDALAQLARADHVGKLVIEMTDTTGLRCREAPGPAGTVRPDRLYLVTGGTGGIGPHIARWLAQRGARHLVLVGRRGRLDPPGNALVDGLRAEGTDVHIAALDVTDRTAVDGFLQEQRARGIPLGGLVHAAGISHDLSVADLSPDDLHLVVAPKLLGAAALHDATRGDPLDFFLLTSSVSALTGTTGQASYAAANAAIEAFAHWRRRQGRPAVAVALGPVAEVGMAARHDNIERYIRLYGYTPLPTDRLPAILDRALDWNRPVLGVFDVDWSNWADAEPHTAASARFASLLASTGALDAASSEMREALARLPDHQRLLTLVAAIIDALAKVLRVDASKLDADTQLISLGLDSLMVLELQTHLNRTLGAELSLMGLLGVNTIEDAARAVDRRLIGVGNSGDR